MFDFSASQSPSSSPDSLVTSNFWVYWVVTVPLTLFILAIWKTWMHLQTKSSFAEKESLKQERILTYQSNINESLALNTPFYPTRGEPGHLKWEQPGEEGSNPRLGL